MKQVSIKIWMTFNEINSGLVMPINGLGFSIQKEEENISLLSMPIIINFLQVRLI